MREPLLEQQKKTDEKQDKVIEKLTEHHLALTDSCNKLIELLETLTLQKPEIIISPSIETTPSTSKIEKCNLDKFLMNKESIDILDKYAYFLPSAYKDNKDLDMKKKIFMMLMR